MELARLISVCALALGTLVGGTAPPAPGAIIDLAPVAVTGLLPAGAAVQAAQVFAIDDDARVQVGQALSRTEVWSNFTRTGRTYTLKIDPARVPLEAIDAGGVVDLELRFTDSESTWATFVSSRMVANTRDARVAWVDPTESFSGARTSSRRLAGRQSRQLPTVSARTDLPVPMTTAKDLGRPIRSSSRIAARAAVPSAACDYKYVKDSNRTTTIATSYPYTATNSWLDVEHTEGGSYGLAFNTGTGFSAQGSRFAGGGWGNTWPKSTKLRSYRIEVNYHYYRGGCGGSYWAPHIETGGATSNYYGLTRPTWNSLCGPVENGANWRRYFSSGKAYSFGQAVKFKDVIGIDLSAKKEYSNNHTLHYFIGGVRPRKLCGNNDFPSYAGKMVERLR